LFVSDPFQHENKMKQLQVTMVNGNGLFLHLCVVTHQTKY